MPTALATTDSNTAIIAGFGNSTAFDFMQRQAQMLASSALMPKEFSLVGIKDPQEKAQKIANVMIALEMANRIGASPMMVAQNIYIVHGKPSWSSTFIIAAINGCGRFNAMKFEMSGEGDDRTCVAVATEKSTGEKLDSPPVSVAMAKKEGWYGKAGSKWQTMPELMLRYRAATLFGRLYAPEILMGMRSVEELEDIETVIPETKKTTAKAITERFKPAPEDLPITKEEIAEVTDKTGLLQEIYQMLAQLSEIKGESCDDLIDEFTGGKCSCQIDLEDKAMPYLNDIKIVLHNAIHNTAEVSQ